MEDHQKTNSHEYIELKKLKLNYCYKHEQNYQYFCYKCNKIICNNCLIEHNKHKYLHIDLIINKAQKRSSFEKFIENSEEMKNIKYKELIKNINDLKNYNNKQVAFLNEFLKEIIQIFCNDLRISIDLVNFSKIIFSTLNKIPNNKENDEIINQYNKIIERIKEYLSIENLEVFKEIIIEKKNKYILFCDELTKEEKKKLNSNINKILNQKTKNVSDSDKKKDYITNVMESSNIIKKFINVEKIKHPDNYINIDNNINNIDNYFSKRLSKNNDYSLSLLVKSVENNGIEMNVSKKRDGNFEKIESASIQSVFALSQQKKYELNFNLKSEDKNNLIKNKKCQDIFIIDNKRKISEELKIKSNNIILTALDYNNLIFNLSIINEGKINFKDVKKLEKTLNLKKIKEKPLIESLQVSEKILDPKWNRRSWISGETRGGENYIPPINWEGIALKVENEYDNGNNDWLGYDNKKENEYSIAYYGLNNDLEDKNVNISEYNVHANKIKELIKDDFYQDQIDERNENQKCGEGLCLYQDPIWAENTSRIIDIPGYNISIKVLLMCRVKPNKIRQPKNFPGCWILNPTPDEIRPYRILFKKVTKSSLGAQLKLSIKPEDFIINILNSKNVTFYELAKDKNYNDKLI